MALEQKIIDDLQGEPIKTPHSIFGHAVYLSIHPGRLILLPFKHWFEKKYQGHYKFERAVFSFDLFLISIVLTLTIVAFFLILFPFKQFHDDVNFTATVAPHEVVVGAPSTLVIDYRNNTKEPLRNPKLDLTFPNHFFLQSISYNGTNVQDKNISLSDIPVGGTGTIHIQGIMFGDVGGKQTFGSTLNFIHGKKESIADQKTAEYTFSPTHSTLSLELTLPNRAVAMQSMSGIITYKNTGTMDLKEIHIKPEWPAGFVFQDASAEIRNGDFILTNVPAGSSGEIRFEGKFGSVPNNLAFIFHPSFVFDKDEYKQETLTQTVPILPAQIQLTESVETNILTPGSNAIFHVHYKHIGNQILRQVKIGITSHDPFLAKQESFAPILDTLKPDSEGDLTFTIPVLANVDTKLLTSYENIHVRTNAIAQYTLDNQSKEQITTMSDPLSTPLTTPLNIESFARYTTPEGDQIGRGPLPPRVGQKTSYWIIWHMDGTTNTINHSVIDGILPQNVSFTGNETSSEDGGVVFNPTTRKISWNISSIPPTLDPTSKVFSVAFELVLTPTTDQIGSPALLMKNIHFTGTDTVTGVSLHTTKPDISTNLQDDKMAKGKGIVR